MPSTVDAGLDLLTGNSAGELMDAVLDVVDGRVSSWSVTQVDHQPGSRTTASYSARVRWADGSVTDELLGACSGELPTGVARLGNGHTEIGMWRFPFDPDLPALPVAWEPKRVSGLLHGSGVLRAGTLPEVRLRAYRPRRRAVVEVSVPGGDSVFAKVLRPHKARRLHERHRIATSAGLPVPASLGWSDNGLVVLAALPGRTLRDALLSGSGAGISVAGILELLDALPDELTAGARRRTWGQRAGHYAEILGSAVPSVAQRARRIADAVHHDEPEGPDVAVHGDFYESQLMVLGDRITGLLDIDTAGRGERLDDAGCLLAHLSVLRQIHPAHAETIGALGSRCVERFARDLDRSALARRTAAVVLSLATGPHRVQERDWPSRTEQRIELAEQWLEFAGTC